MLLLDNCEQIADGVAALVDAVRARSSGVHLLVTSQKPLRGWGAFGRAGVSDDNTNPIAWFLSFGLGGSGPFESRPQDTFGVGWYYSATSDQIGPLIEALVGPIGDGQGMEIFYNYELAPAIHITPDVQVIVPAEDDIDPSLIFGVRAKMDF